MAKFSHAILEKNVILLAIATLITVSIGGLVEIVPLYTIKSTIEPVQGVRPYSPLELAGRNIYIREGCYNCHSQMVRPFRDQRRVRSYRRHARTPRVWAASVFEKTWPTRKPGLATK